MNKRKRNHFNESIKHLPSTITHLDIWWNYEQLLEVTYLIVNGTKIKRR